MSMLQQSWLVSECNVKLEAIASSDHVCASGHSWAAHSLHTAAEEPANWREPTHDGSGAQVSALESCCSPPHREGIADVFPRRRFPPEPTDRGALDNWTLDS